MFTDRYDRQMALRSNGDPIDIDGKSKSSDLPLSGVRVLELGQLIAGPFAGQLLGFVEESFVACAQVLNAGFHFRHFGAEIIKVEPPTIGDPIRVWRELDVDWVSPWFRSMARNKKSVTIDLRKPEGRECVPPSSNRRRVGGLNYIQGLSRSWQ